MKTEIDHSKCWNFLKNMNRFLKLQCPSPEGVAAFDGQIKTMKNIELMFGKISIKGKENE